MIGMLLKEIHLTVHPLLVLTADQIKQFSCGLDEFGQNDTHNLDTEATVLGEYHA